jgi:hypothetical protein
MKHLVLLALLLQGCSCVSPDLIAARRLPPAFSAPPRLPVPLSCVHQPGSTPALRLLSTPSGALGLHALDRGNDQGDRRSALKSAVQLGQLVLGGILAPGAARAEEGPPPQVVPRRRRGSNPFGSLTPSSSSSSSTAAATTTSFSSFTLCSTLYPRQLKGACSLCRSCKKQLQHYHHHHHHHHQHCEARAS